MAQLRYASQWSTKRGPGLYPIITCKDEEEAIAVLGCSKIVTEFVMLALDVETAGDRERLFCNVCERATKFVKKGEDTGLVPHKENCIVGMAADFLEAVPE